MEHRSSELFYALIDCNSRGLYQTAKWLAELKLSIKSTEPNPTECKKDLLEIKEEDRILLAKSYFDCKEFHRASHVLQDCESQKAIFIRNYSLFLAGEKRKEEELIESVEKLAIVNTQIKAIRDELEYHYSNNNLDGFNLYLLGVIFKELDLKEQSKTVLVESINRYPWNWSAWSELVSLCNEHDNISELSSLINDHWMKEFFIANLSLELQQNETSLQLYVDLSKKYPDSNYVIAQTAIANYNLREFDTTEQLFELLIEKDPYRIDNLDTYSNVLYVKENKSKLSFLAHKTTETDKYRPESCCIIGNYYSIKSEHEKAITYFKRALKLNRKFLSAWTLMGHEYVEMKNTKAAIEAYRKAVDINPRDYRAWYGLGQTYELLKMPLYSLYYYNKAATLKPYDSRMWCAMAGCYEELSRIHDAIQCYERAESHKDREGIALFKLAKLYDSLNNQHKAANYYKKNLELRDQEGVEGPETTESLLYLANYCKSHNSLEEAEIYCTRLLDFAGKEKEEAKAILREIHSVHSSNYFQSKS